MPAPIVRLALIGVGRWGKNFARTIQQLDGVKLSAVVSRNPDTATLVPPDCRILSDWRVAIADHDIDGVVVATPPDSHAEILLAAIKTGKPILIEKPVCISRDEASRIRVALNEKPADVLVDNIHLFHPAFRELLRRSRMLGPVRSIESSAGNRGPYRRDASVLWDWAPHDLAMCLSLVPGTASVVEARRLDSRTVEGVPAEDIAIDLRLAGGVPARVRISTLTDQHRWFAVEFAATKLVYRDRGPQPLIELPPASAIDLEGAPITVSQELPLTRAVLDFRDLVVSRTGSRTSIDLSLNVVDLIADIDAHLARQ